MLDFRAVLYSSQPMLLLSKREFKFKWTFVYDYIDTSTNLRLSEITILELLSIEMFW